jgi:diguanylate cyclase (GGDEF)-like protein
VTARAPGPGPPEPRPALPVARESPVAHPRRVPTVVTRAASEATPPPGPGSAVAHPLAAEEPPPSWARRADPRRWRLWPAPLPVVAGVLGVDLIAVVVGVLLAGAEPVGAGNLRMLGLLALGCAVHVEATRGIEKRREVVSTGRPYIELKSMWSFAGLLLLPISLALALVVVTFAYGWFRAAQPPVPHRWTYSAATVVLGSAAAWFVLGAGPPNVLGLVAGPTGLLVVVAAGLTRWLVNHGLVVAMISLSAPGTPWWQRLGSPTDTLIGLGALALGAALAVLATDAPWLVPVLLLPVMGMHRGFLIQQLALAARTDPKTGLVNAVAWRDQADRELARIRRRGGTLGILMVDIDAFKAINDRHGHLVGDAVLRAVADAMRAEVRGYDAVGRFGGEEFVVLLSEAGPEEAAGTAERLRRRISDCEVALDPADGGGTVQGLTASIGAATFPRASTDLAGLMRCADSALYAAKHGGRNRVESAPPR